MHSASPHCTLLWVESWVAIFCELREDADYRALPELLRVSPWAPIKKQLDKPKFVRQLLSHARATKMPLQSIP
jgi:hypothetical protein